MTKYKYLVFKQVPDFVGEVCWRYVRRYPTYEQAVRAAKEYNTPCIITCMVGFVKPNIVHEVFDDTPEKALT